MANLNCAISVTDASESTQMDARSGLLLSTVSQLVMMKGIAQQRSVQRV